MTPNQRRRIARALIAAKPHLAENHAQVLVNPHTQYICIALMLSRHPDWAKANAVIGQRLGSTIGGVINWLHDNVPECGASLKGLSREEIITEYQQYRHRWLDSLIEEYSA